MNVHNLANISLGTDPELFVENEDGSVLPAYFAIGGDVDIALPYGKAYCDGAAVEFTVDPSNDPYEITQRLGANIRALQAAIGKPITSRSNGFVAQHYIDALPESYGKRASLQILGCDADVRVYDWAQPIQRPNPKFYNYRTLGGHIHIGVGTQVLNDIPLVTFTTAAADLMLGTAGTYLCDEPESRDRKKLYGKSGTIRIKEYGAIEYRPLPSKVLTSNAAIAYHCFALAQKVGWFVGEFLNRTENDYIALLALLGGVEKLQALTTAIDEHDVKACRKMQLEAAQAFDAINYSPGFLPHVESMLAMELPDNFQLEW